MPRYLPWVALASLLIGWVAVAVTLTRMIRFKRAQRLAAEQKVARSEETAR